MTCKDCYHEFVCAMNNDLYRKAICAMFKDKSQIVELPCRVGDTVYRIIDECNAPYNYCPYNGGYGTARCDKESCKAYIKEISFSLPDIENIGKAVFLTREEAERALKGGEE